MFFVTVSKQEKSIFISTKEMVYIQHNEKSLVLWHKEKENNIKHLKVIKEINNRMNVERDKLVNDEELSQHSSILYLLEDITDFISSNEFIPARSGFLIDLGYLASLTNLFSKYGYVLKYIPSYTTSTLFDSLVKFNTIPNNDILTFNSSYYGSVKVKYFTTNNHQYLIHDTLIEKYNKFNIKFDELDIKTACVQYHENKILYIDDITGLQQIESILHINDSELYCVTYKGISKLMSDGNFRAYYIETGKLVEDLENPEYIIVGDIKYPIITKIPNHDKHFVTKYNDKLQLLDLTNLQYQLVKTIKQKQNCDINGISED